MMLSAGKYACRDIDRCTSRRIGSHVPHPAQLSTFKHSSVCTKAADLSQPLFYPDIDAAQPSSLPLPAAVTAAVAAVTSSVEELGSIRQNGSQRQRLFGPHIQEDSSRRELSFVSDVQQQQVDQGYDAASESISSHQIADRLASNALASSSNTASPELTSAAASTSSRKAPKHSSTTHSQQQQHQYSQQAHRQRARHHDTVPRYQRTVSWYREQANRRLTVVIGRAQDITTLRHIMRQYEGSMNYIHVNAVFGQLVNLVANRQLRSREMLMLNSFIPQVLQLVASALPDYNERCISNTLRGLAVLELYQERDLLNTLLVAAERISLSCFTPQGLANTSWALASLHVTPGAHLTQQLLVASSKGMAQFNAQELAMIGWAFGTMRIRPTETWTASYQAAIVQQLDRLTHQGLSMVLWGAAQMREAQQSWQPSAHMVPVQSSNQQTSVAAQAEPIGWLQAVEQTLLYRTSNRGRHQLTPHSVSICLWALARLRHKPSSSFLTAVLDMTRPQLQGRSSPADLAVLLHSLAMLQFHPSRRWLAGHAAAVVQAVHRLSARQVSNMLWAYGKLGLPMQDTPVLQQLMTRLYYEMQNASARDLASSLWGLAAAGVQPEKRWMSVFGAQAEALIHNCCPQEVANLLWAYASLGQKPPHMLLVALWEGVGIGTLGGSVGATSGTGVAVARLSAFKPMELSMLVWALAKLQVVPGKEWWEQFLQASYHKMHQQAPQGLANIIWAITELGLQPPPAWLYHWAAAARGVLSEMNPIDLGQVAAALQSAVVEPLQLPKLEALLLDVLDRLAAVELQSGAYSRAALELLMRIPAVAGEAGIQLGPSSSKNGRAVLRQLVQQQREQQQKDAQAAAAASAAKQDDHARNGSGQHVDTDREVQQLKQLLERPLLQPPPKRPAHIAHVDGAAMNESHGVGSVAVGFPVSL